MAKKKIHPLDDYDKAKEIKRFRTEDKAAKKVLEERGSRYIAHPDSIVIWDKDGKPIHNKALEKQWERMAAEEAKAEAAAQKAKNKAKDAEG